MDSAATLARKQRYIFLLEKVKANKALTPAEMRELDGYEAARKAEQEAQQTAKPVNADPVACQGKRGEKAKALSEQGVREAAFACEDLAAAGVRLGVADLKGRLDRSQRLAAAWDRGRLLRRVREVAGTTYIVADTADKILGLAKGEFRRIYAADRIVRELWNTTRFDLLLATEQGFAARVKEGDLKAIAAVEVLFASRRPAAGEVDYGRLTPAELGRATGILAQQWARWVRENGCPQSVDGSYSLAKVLDWLRKWERDKVTGGREAAGLNPLQSEKARREKRENDEAEGRLVPIDVHIEALTARAHCLYGVASPNRVKDVVVMLAGKTAPEQEDVLNDAFGRVLEAYKTLSPDISLSDEARAKFEEGLALLMKTE